MRMLKQATAANVMVFMADSSDHVTGKTGLTLTITASKDGAAFGSISPAVTERGSGWYSLALTTAHTDTLGDLALHVTSTGADPTDFACRVVAIDLADAVAFGVSRIDAAISSRLATSGYTAPPTAAAIRAEIDSNSTKLDVAVSTRLASASYTAPDNSSIATILGRVDVATSTRLASGSYSAPPSAAAIRAEIDANSSKLDVAVGTRLATGSYTAPDNATTALISKLLRNKTITNPSTGVMTLYDDDGVTPLYTANIFEDVAGSQAYRGQGADRRDRLQ